MKVYLRKVTPEDGKLIVRWRNNPKVLSHVIDQTKITDKTNSEFYQNYVQTGIYQQYIVERIEEQYGVAAYPIASVFLRNIDDTNKRCELGFFPSDDQEWNSDSQILAVKDLLKIAFDEMKMNKVYTYVFSGIDDEKELMIKAGFEEECLLKSEYIAQNGSYKDIYRMCVFNRK